RGADAFRAGIRQCMQRHAYGSSTTEDLWIALEAASGMPVASVAKAFTELPGVPLIVSETKCIEGEQRLALRQERFAVHDPNPAPQRWLVPLMFGTLPPSRSSQWLLFDPPFDM